MPLAAARIAELACELEGAALEGRAIPKITLAEPGLPLEEAYDVQWALRERRLRSGCTLTGLKMGLTSLAKAKQMGVETPIYGFLLDEHRAPADSEIEIAGMLHPRVEAEIAVVTRRELYGPDCTLEQALVAIDQAIPALEVIDSRYRDFTFDLPSVVADNASSARYVVGETRRPLGALDLRAIGVVLEKNGEPVASGIGAAVLGHPAQSLAMLANLLARRGEHVPSGTFVMTGGITEAIAAKPGDRFVARYEHLGCVSVGFT